MYFDSCFMSSMDAHRGAYNVTIKDSTFQHMNFIGEGTLSIENVTVYADYNNSGLVLRGDYGSTWNGEINISGFELKYETAKWLQIIDARWNNHYFGYSTYLPHTVRLDRIKATKVSYELDANGERKETVIYENQMPLHFSYYLEAYINADISNPDADMKLYPTDDKVSCDCIGGINDTTGDGRCDNVGCGLPTDGSKYDNVNPYAGTKKLYVTNSPGLILVLPTTEQFAEMEVFVDGETVSWHSEGKIICPSLN